MFLGQKGFRASVVPAAPAGRHGRQSPATVPVRIESLAAVRAYRNRAGRFRTPLGPGKASRSEKQERATGRIADQGYGARAAAGIFCTGQTS